MANTSIKITALTDIGSNISFNDIIPIVNMTGTPETEKANVQILGNLILEGAGGLYFKPAAVANIAQTVSNSAQPNITSVGTLSNLVTTGNITIAENITVEGTGPLAATDTTIAFKIPVEINGNTYYIALTAAQ